MEKTETSCPHWERGEESTVLVYSRRECDEAAPRVCALAVGECVLEVKTRACEVRPAASDFAVE